MEFYEKMIQTDKWVSGELRASWGDSPSEFEARRKSWETHFDEASELWNILTDMKMRRGSESDFGYDAWNKTLVFLMKTDSKRAEPLAGALPIWTRLPEQGRMYAVAHMLSDLSVRHCPIAPENLFSLLHLLETPGGPDEEDARQQTAGNCYHLLGQRRDEAWREMLLERVNDLRPGIVRGALQGLIELEGLMPCWWGARPDFGPPDNTEHFAHLKGKPWMVSWILLTHDMICGDGLPCLKRDECFPQTPERYVEQLEEVGLSESAKIVRQFIPLLPRLESDLSDDGWDELFAQIEPLNQAYFDVTPNDHFSIMMMRYVLKYAAEFKSETSWNNEP